MRLTNSGTLQAILAPGSILLLQDDGSLQNIQFGGMECTFLPNKQHTKLTASSCTRITTTESEARVAARQARATRRATRKQLRRMDAHTWRESIALWQRLGKDGFVVGTGGEIYFVAV